MMGIGDEPLPYTPVDYIVTDGACYILPGRSATPPQSSEIKVMMGSNPSACCLLGGWQKSSGADTKMFVHAKYYAQKAVGFSYYYNYGDADGVPSVEWSVDNAMPFIVKTSMKKGAQVINVKQDNSDSWVTYSKARTENVSSTYGIVILNGYQNSSYSLPAPSGTRLYYCKIYSDETYTNLFFDGIPCLYNGEYGLWDRVSNSFKGNSGSGTFSGPSNA